MTGTRAMTIMELLTVIVIIMILMMLLVPVASSMQARADKARCMANLRNLSVAANLYLQQHGHWPQISTSLLSSNRKEYAAQWIAALAPYGISQEGWICPTTQRLMKKPDLTKRENIRVDYNAMPFDRHPTTPLRWAKHPWFIEHNSVHGNGNLIIYTDGTIVEALNLIPKSGT